MIARGNSRVRVLTSGQGVCTRDHTGPQVATRGKLLQRGILRTSSTLRLPGVNVPVLRQKLHTRHVARVCRPPSSYNSYTKAEAARRVQGLPYFDAMLLTLLDKFYCYDDNIAVEGLDSSAQLLPPPKLYVP